MGAGGVFLGETLAISPRRLSPEMPDEWWMYGPFSLVIGMLALFVAGSAEPGRTCTGRTRTLPSH